MGAYQGCQNEWMNCNDPNHGRYYSGALHIMPHECTKEYGVTFVIPDMDLITFDASTPCKDTLTGEQAESINERLELLRAMMEALQAVRTGRLTQTEAVNQIEAYSKSIEAEQERMDNQ